ncbi:hypothetical protein PHYBOEH_007588 [Phytophthora boehmeriae]|uniref:Necrosis inducing-like protein NPP1 type n=1 Tax=Phytophthora boehmeriae TaxID=109152 RepID=A0A8T1X0V3_9STRA|nr:hypothetical protein PHYBOEH_007588 [Phytophthora boehmeriae]
MKLHNFIAVAAAVVTAIGAATIEHDKVQPFAQPHPVTISEKVAIRFKPSLAVEGGCHPYPAVNAAGEINGGLKPSGSPSGGCEKPKLGSQIYGRAGWHNDLWAIMYAWYFPKDDPRIWSSHRHDWESIVVWIDNPDANPPVIQAIAVWGDDYSSFDVTTRYEDFVNGSSPNIRYNSEASLTDYRIDLVFLDDSAEFQDLIMWEQLTGEARLALERTDFGDTKVPFNDATFQSRLDGAWPSKLTKRSS